MSNCVVRRSTVGDGSFRSLAVVLAGPILGLVSADVIAPAIPFLSPIALIIVLFEGGLELSWDDMRKHAPRALAMAVDDLVLAPVLSQPSLPLMTTKSRRRSIDTSDADLAVVKGRCDREGLQVLGLRFHGDPFVSAERFDFLREQLGDAFVAVELDDAAAKPHTGMPPHSVLTEHPIDEPGQPTRDALDRVLELFKSRLLPSDGALAMFRSGPPRL